MNEAVKDIFRMVNIILAIASQKKKKDDLHSRREEVKLIKFCKATIYNSVDSFLDSYYKNF